MKYFVIAGEASGDIHAARLIKALSEQDTGAQFKFFGGDSMEQASGVAPSVHYKDMAYMGFVEVIKHLGAIMGFMKKARGIIDEWKPDAGLSVVQSQSCQVRSFAGNSSILLYLAKSVGVERVQGKADKEIHYRDVFDLAV